MWREIAETESLAVVGMAKNTGKTTTINHLVQECRAFGLTPGLTSTGRDGEDRDVLYGIPKPSVWLPPGALVATAEEALRRSAAPWEVLEYTGGRTPMGPMVIARVPRGGRVEVAGPQTRRELQAVVRRLGQLGARPVLVDGAFDRVAGAAPTVARGVILAAGAALDADMAAVVRLTRTRVEQLSLPQPDLKLAVPALFILPRGGVWLLSDGGRFQHLLPCALGSRIRLPAIPEEARAVLVAGAVGEGFLSEYGRALSRRPGLALILKHAACLFAEPQAWQRLKSLGGRVYALEPVHLLAVTVNPVSPRGWRFETRRFREEMAAAVYPLPVYDWGPGDGGEPAPTAG